MSQKQPLCVKRELIAEDVVDASIPIELAVSPDGRWVAYQVSRVGKRAGAPQTSLWLAPTDGGSPARMLADDRGLERVFALGAGLGVAVRRLRPERARHPAAVPDAAR